MTDLEVVLNRLAVQDDPVHGWEVYRNVEVTRVQAATLETFPSITEAVTAAETLYRALIDAGGEPVSTSKIAAWTDPAVGEGWRGTVLVVFNHE
jgi:hypothetical protein